MGVATDMFHSKVFMSLLALGCYAVIVVWMAKTTPLNLDNLLFAAIVTGLLILVTASGALGVRKYRH